eukprot:TRINITY_DN861_c0_g1_i4.p3 TRINITY_DN861_c0_g1~~TRINITY_DN861_c0_g1_i4.p3  ORF type:complete len:158 (-),score=34.99 TRINITY_DN861_c0_g1_i4:138-611(-)
MKKWNRKQLREHYINFIKCKNVSTDFTSAEDAAILTHVKDHGHTWKDLVNKLPGRSPIGIKNRYYKVLVKRCAVQSETGEETKGGTRGGTRASSGNGSTNDRVSEEKIGADEKMQTLVVQEEKLIKGIKAIEKRIENLKVDINSNVCNVIQICFVLV